MLREQRWTPDTCTNSYDACVLIEQWDDSVAPEARTHTYVRTERICSRHAAEGVAGEALFAANMDQNRRKNVSLNLIKTAVASVDLTLITWSYSNGVLTVDAGTQLTNQQKTQIQNLADVQFGPGKVIIL